MREARSFDEILEDKAIQLVTSATIRILDSSHVECQPVSQTTCVRVHRHLLFTYFLGVKVTQVVANQYDIFSAPEPTSLLSFSKTNLLHTETNLLHVQTSTLSPAKPIWFTTVRASHQ